MTPPSMNAAMILAMTLALAALTGCGAELSASKSSSASNASGIAGSLESSVHPRPRITPRPAVTPTSIPDSPQLKIEATFEVPELSSTHLVSFNLEHLAITPALGKGLELDLAEAHGFELRETPPADCPISPIVLALSASSESLSIALAGSDTREEKTGTPPCLEYLIKLRSQGFTAVFTGVPLRAKLAAANMTVPEDAAFESVTIVARPNAHSDRP